MINATECGLVGIDVAWPQGPALDWSVIEKSRIRFAICKATHGTVGVDPTYARNASEVHKTTIVLGAYHWFEPAQDPIAQARHFVRTAGVLDILAIDFEDSDGGAVKPRELLAGVLAMAREVTRLTGRKPLIYTGKYFALGAEFDASDELASYPLWHAQYPSTKPDARPYQEAVCALASEPSIAGAWAKRQFHESIWQFDGDGGLRLPNGIDVDVNRFRGGYADFVAWLASLVVGPALSPLEWGDVRALQMALATLGFATGPIDGLAGAKTRAATSAYQALAGLDPHGRPDNATLAALAASLASLGRAPVESLELAPDPRGPAPRTALKTRS